jgi:hypothetical protein
MDANIAGFGDAQQRLRAQFGESAVFLQAPVFSYPGGTPIDPDTDRPYDPVIQPSASAQASATVNVSVSFVAQGRTSEDADREGPAGFADRTRVMLIADLADRPLCEGAVTVLLRDGRYQVTSMKADGIGELQRWLTYARRGG